MRMEPSEVVAKLISAVESKDVSAAVALLAPQISYENMPMDPIVGQESVAAVLDGFLGPAKTVEWRILNQWEFGDTVINERIDRFQIGDGWLELPVAGVFRVDTEGRITLWRDYFDMGGYTRQLDELLDS